MESLLPSEIARLVYGYLMEEKCDAAAQMFLETSGPLQECNLALKKGRKFSTRILGLSLLDILNIYTDAVCMLRNYKEKKASGNDSTNEQRDSASLNIELNNVIQELESVLLAGEHPEKNTPKTIFVRISIPRNFSGQGLCAVPLSTSSLAGNSHVYIRGRKTTSAHFPHYLLCSPLLRKVSSSDNKSDKKETEKKEAERKEKEKEKSQNQGGGDECFENTTVSKNVSSSLDDFDLNMLQTLLDNTALHERIAENINKAIDSSGEINTSETNEKKIVETVLHSTEADPIFEELLHMLAVPRAEDTTTPEDTDKEGGDPVEERSRPAGQVTPQEQQAMQNIEAENTLAIEAILARNKTAQESGTVATSASDAQMNQGGESSVIHVAPPMMTSTPVQTMMAGVPTFVGILSPVQPRCTGQTLLVPLNTLPPDVVGGRRRNLAILPKSDAMKRPVMKLQVQTPGSDKTEIIHAVPVVKAHPPRPSKPTTDKAASGNTFPAKSSVRETVKLPRVRTRGGLHKGGTSRGLKSISPQITQIGDDKIHVVLSENVTGVKTRSMVKGPSQPKVVVDSVHNTLEVIPEESQVSEREEDRIPQQNAHLPISDLSSPGNHDSQSMSTLPNLQVETQSSLPVVETDKHDLSSELRTSGSVTSLSTEEVCREQNMENPKILNKNAKGGILNSIDELLSKKLNCSPETELTDKENSTVTNISVDVAPKITDGNGTPLQQANTTKVKKRVSLSTPRRGSHVRVLDFKTPDKKINLRKSLTSPKACSKSEKIDFMVEKAKRGILKSPELKKSQGCDKNDSPPEEGNAETGEPLKCIPPKRDWDADLRKFMDIPTSVGLKRKNTAKKEPRKTMPKKKIIERKVTKNVKKKKANDSEPVLTSDKCSSEDLVEQIEKEVREVIREEEISLTSIEESDNILKSNLMNSQSSNKSQKSSSAESMEIDEQTHCHETEADDRINKQDPTLKPGMDISDKVVDLEKKCDDLENISDGINPVIIDIADTCNTVVADNMLPQDTTCCSNTSTPLKILSPNKEEVLGQMTPTTKLILNQLSLNYSPSCSNLESILISEGTRLEQENAFRSVKSDIIKLPDHFELESQKEDGDGSPNVNNKKISCNTEEIKRHIPVDCVLKQSVPQTPAKFLSAPLPLNIPVEATPAGKMTPGFHVEMTPLSKVLHSTTKFLSTKLVTPTLPTTPKPQDEKSPDKTDSLINISSDNENEKDKIPGEKIGEMQKDPTTEDQVIHINKHIPKTTLSEESVISAASNNISPKESESIAVIKSPSRSTKNKPIPKTPLVKLVRKKPKIVKSPTVKKTIKKTNVKKILSSSESEEESIESGNMKSVDTNVKTSSPDQNSENISVNNSLNKSIKRKNPSTPKPKQKCVEATNNKKNKKMPSAKKQFEINLLKQEEEVLKECLEKAKAKALFGFISSESDSSDDNVSKITTVPPTPVTSTKISASKLHDPLKPELENAFHILKQIKSASMLFSSSSSEDDNDESDGLPPKRLAHSDSRKVKIPFKIDPPKSVPTSSQNISSKTTSNLTGQVLVSPGNKKLDSPKKIDRTSKEITKLVSREKEESCESFPALYLSEESNISGISESHNAKFMKSRKSPSVGSDRLIFKKTVISSSSHLNAQLKSNTNKSNNSKLTLASSKSVPSVKTKDVNEPLDVYESVHTTSTTPVVISGQESKALSEYLNNYSFTFTLDEENGVNTKTLRTSPFFTILEMDFTKNQQASRGRPKIRSPSHSPERNRVDRILSPRKACRERNVSPKNDQNIIRSPSPQRERQGRKSSPQKGPHERNLSPQRIHRLPSPHRDRDRGRNLSPQRDRHRKRPRSESSSSDDERRNFRRHQSNIRREYWDSRSHFRRSKFPRKKTKFYSPHFQGSPYYRERFDSYRGPKFIPPESSSRSHKRSSNEHPEKSPSGFHIFEKHYNFNDSVRSSRSKESDRLLVDQSFEHSDSPLEKSRVSQRSYPSHSDTYHQRKAKSQRDREEGELSDTSGFHTATTPDNVAEAKRKKPTSTVPDSSRANLLNKVDLDSFLTLLHGAEEEK